MLRHSQSCFALVSLHAHSVPADSGLVFQPICHPGTLLLFLRVGGGQWEGDCLWDCDPMSIARISCRTLNTMPSLAGEEPFPTWSGLSSHTPCGLAPSTFTTRPGHAPARYQRGRCQDQWVLQPSETTPNSVLGQGCVLECSWPNQGWPWPQPQQICLLQGQGCVWSHIPTSSHSPQSLSTVACSFPILPGLKTLESSFFHSSPSKFDSLPYY